MKIFVFIEKSELEINVANQLSYLRISEFLNNKLTLI